MQHKIYLIHLLIKVYWVFFVFYCVFYTEYFDRTYSICTAKLSELNIFYCARCLKCLFYFSLIKTLLQKAANTKHFSVTDRIITHIFTIFCKNCGVSKTIFLLINVIILVKTTQTVELINQLYLKKC